MSTKEQTRNMTATDDGTNIDRRRFLQKLSTVVGYTAASSLLAGSGMSAALAYTPKPDSASRAGVTFSKSQMQVLKHICDTVIPRTDTASAGDVDCHGFVDHQLLQCHSKQEQAQCIAAVDMIDAKAQSAHGNSYTQITTQQQTGILVDIEALNGFSAEQKGHFSLLKAILVFGYFTSEEGLTKALEYHPFPGGYKGRVPVDENTKSSGSMAYY
jgi:hypothetical protein